MAEEKWLWMVYPLSSIKNNGFEWIKQSALALGLRVEIIIADRLSIDINCGDNSLQKNLDTECLKAKILLDGKYCKLPRLVIMRHYDRLLSEALEKNGIRVVNSTNAMELSCNKIKTHLKLIEAAVPQPHTLSLSNCAASYSVASKIVGTPFVLKSPVGSKGDMVWMVKNQKEFDAARKQCGQTLLAQEFISHSAGRDVRVWLVDGRAIAAVERRAVSGFKSNYSLGGEVVPFSLADNAAAAQLAVDAAGALGLEFSGVDLLFKKDGTFLVCEVNGNAAFRSITSMDKKANIPYHLFSYINRLFESIVADNLEN